MLNLRQKPIRLQQRRQWQGTKTPVGRIEE